MISVFTKQSIKKNIPIIIILLIALLVRLPGINYGLPLWLVGDEVSHIFGALKMVELKTLLPVLHHAEFFGVMYYTPYLSFVYVIPFILVAGLKFLFFSGTIEEFKNFSTLDVSSFFIIARMVSVGFGIATVWLVYKSAKNLFKNEYSAIFSALFLSFSFFHVNYSNIARHWTVITFFFALVLFILSKNISTSKKILYTFITVGIAMGFNVQALFILVFAMFWLLIVDKISIQSVISKLSTWKSFLILIVLFAIPYAIWPVGYGYLSKVSASNIDTVSQANTSLLSGFWFYLSDLFKAEPILLLFIIIGSMVMFLHKRKYFYCFYVFFIFFVTSFYLFFTQIDRFLLVLYPFFAIIAGYGFAFVLKKFSARKEIYAYGTMIVVLTLISIPIFKFNYLLLKNDTRVQAIDWIDVNIKENSKIAVLVPLMRLSATKNAIEEQKIIDPDSIRSTDKARLALGDKFINGNQFHALNLYTSNSKPFFGDIYNYLKNNKYEYIIYNEDFIHEKDAEHILNYIDNPIIKFNGSWNNNIAQGNQNIPDGFGGGLKEILTSNSFGPNIKISKINYEN